jgi:hypothetical protein
MTTLLNTAITTAGTITGTPVQIAQRHGVGRLTIQTNFVYGSGGTAADVRVSTSVDDGSTWIEIWHCTQFTTSSGRRAVALPGVTATSSSADINATAALAAGASLDGVFGSWFKASVVSTGTYAGTTVQVDLYSEQIGP